MHYYRVWVSSPKYHKAEPLTYASDFELKIGEIVEVPLQKQHVFGFVAAQTQKPHFVAKPVVRTIQQQIALEQIKLFAWLLRYYPAPSGQTAQLFVPGNVPQKISVPNPESHSDLPLSQSSLPPLTPDQQAALTTIRQQKTGSVLLHGDTGTGKTRVYLELVRDALHNGKSAIILTPEIGLTPQLEQTFRKEFGTRVITSHSHLSEAKRRDIWLALSASTEPRVVIGPRSALFLPVQNLGLIVLDEAHDASYKQEQAPHYQTTRVAAKLAQLHGCLSIFGTATPLIADYYSLQKNNMPIIRMTRPVHASIKPPVISVVNRTDKEQFRQSWLFSDSLISAVAAAKQAGQTSLIFLNRRGTARIMLCQNCSWQADCPHCDVPLTYHSDTHALLCHICGYSQTPPLACPVCQSTELSLHAAGTKALETELSKLFPEYALLRIDSDTTGDNRLEKQYDRILSGKVDILIGTQMITKGLDLPNLGLVGIPFADSSLYLPDFTADEQTYHLLRQVIGRVGRTTKPTKVIIQTYQPDQPIINAAKNKDWDIFYNAQLKERRTFAYPPFCYLMQLTASRQQESTLQASGKKLIELIQRQWPEVTALGPSPRFHRKTRGAYQWHIIVKAKKRQTLVDITQQLPAGWRFNLDPTSLL